jgi:eukaryotic-like serine/threonine-protein kinase
MNAERWQAIGELFEQALALPAGERTALLDGACGVDQELRREVASLLASHNAGGGFLQHRIENALAVFHETSVAGTQPARVGPYRLIRELGRGGMGTVFLGERDDDEYHARVAVKLVRPGMDTEFILARFRRERQTLARLQHPNISRLLDGGTTDGGLPYFVMEYIDGPWLTGFADDRRLTVDDRPLDLRNVGHVKRECRNAVIDGVERASAGSGKHRLRSSSEGLVHKRAADAAVRAGDQDGLVRNVDPVMAGPCHG